MSVDAMKSLGSVDPRRAYGMPSAAAAEPQATDFGKLLGQALDAVNQRQQARDALVEGAVRGEVTEVHDVMVAAEEAQLSFELMLEIRNRLLEAYQELMRTQV